MLAALAFVRRYIPTVILAGAAVLGTTPSALSAPAFPLWGRLAPGPHPVGFMVLHEYDHARSWFPQRSADGTPTAAPPGRPVRITVWFPAADAGSGALHFRDYVVFDAPDSSYRELERRLRAYDMGEEGGGLLGLVGGSREKLDALLALPVAARAGARPSPGPFPLVIYSIGQNDMTQENVALWEYLASHGYVVATVPHLGVGPRRFHLWLHEPESFEAQIRDLEFALDRLAREPWVDGRRVAAMGHSMGGTYAMLMAVRNPAIDALIGLDASFVVKQPSFQFDYSSAPYFQPWRLKAPVLQLFRKRDEPDDRVFDQLIYADVHQVELENLTHGDFQGWRLYEAAALDSADLAVRPAAVGARGFEFVAREVLGFLDQTLGDGHGKRPAADRAADGVQVSRRLRAGVRGPDAEELHALLEREGFDRALALVEKVRRENPGRALFADAEVVALGNELRWGGQGERAVEFFRLIAAAEPDSPVAHWKLGQALEGAGEKSAAIEEYRITVRLDPDHALARKRIEALGTSGTDD